MDTEVRGVVEVEEIFCQANANDPAEGFELGTDDELEFKLGQGRVGCVSEDVFGEKKLGRYPSCVGPFGVHRFALSDGRFGRVEAAVSGLEISGGRHRPSSGPRHSSAIVFCIVAWSPTSKPPEDSRTSSSAIGSLKPPLETEGPASPRGGHGVGKAEDRVGESAGSRALEVNEGITTIHIEELEMTGGRELAAGLADSDGVVEAVDRVIEEATTVAQVGYPE